MTLNGPVKNNTLTYLQQLGTELAEWKATLQKVAEEISNLQQVIEVLNLAKEELSGSELHAIEVLIEAEKEKLRNQQREQVKAKSTIRHVEAIYDAFEGVLSRM